MAGLEEWNERFDKLWEDFSPLFFLCYMSKEDAREMLQPDFVEDIKGA